MSISPANIQSPKVFKHSNVLPFRGLKDDPSGYYYLDIARSLDTFEKNMGLQKPGQSSLANTVVLTSVDNAKMAVQEKMDSLTKCVHQLVFKDPMLKNVDNKRAYQRDRVKLCLESCREQKPLGYIAFDIDNFGGYNNEFGHAEGDNALRVFADTVQEVLGDKGILYRIGGEEFAALLPGYNTEQITEITEQIRRAVQVNTKTKTDIGELPGPFTVSLGYASVEPHKELESLHELYEQAQVSRTAKVEFRKKFGEHFEPLEHGADSALYISKLYKGRNSITNVTELQNSEIFDLVLTLGRDIASVMRKSSQDVTEKLVPQLELFTTSNGGEQAAQQLALEFNTIMDTSSNNLKAQLLRKLNDHITKN
ncbi:MAG: GGDEF domain-containing protein [Vampirovibrionia bacterium]